MTLKQKEIVQDSVLQLNKKIYAKFWLRVLTFIHSLKKESFFWNVAFFISLD